MENKIDIELKKMKFVAITYLSKKLWEECIALNEPAIHTMADFFSETIIARLTGKFFTHDEEGEYEFEWYKSWWQELRAKLFPKFWLDRYPSKMETKKKVKAFAAYPSLRINDVVHKAKLQFGNLYVPKIDEDEQE